MRRHPFRFGSATWLLLAAISCTASPPTPLAAWLPVQIAASNFYEKNGRWPCTKDELQTAMPTQRNPPDIRRWSFHFNERPDGSLDIHWAEQNGPALDTAEVNVQRPTSRSAGLSVPSNPPPISSSPE